MANDRMALVCKDCMLGVSIAKFYPGSWAYPLNEKRMDAFFEKHRHKYDFRMVSDKQYFLGYESDELGWKYDDVGIEQPPKETP